MMRARIAAGLHADVPVWMRGGTYQQTETFAFGLEDSRKEKHSITHVAYPGEKVRLIAMPLK